MTKNFVLPAVLSGGRATEVARELDNAEISVASSALGTLLEAGNTALASFSAESQHVVDHVTDVLSLSTSSVRIEDRIQFLCGACFYYDRIGRSMKGIAGGEVARRLAIEHGLKNLERRACNSLAIAYIGYSHFEPACTLLERSLQLARELNDAFLECNALSQITLLLQEMGLYRDAIRVADRALAYAVDTEAAQHVKTNAAGNALFCAHRLGDEDAALRFMSYCSAHIDNPRIDPASRASFEYYRTLHLLGLRDFETADDLLEAARNKLDGLPNPRVKVLMTLSMALCDWESGAPVRRARARQALVRLYDFSRKLNVHHDDVLRALTRVYSTSGDAEDTRRAMKYAKELVEYLTGVKRARFYRQLSERGVTMGTSDTALLEDADPLAGAKLMLTPDVAHAIPVTKHEELFAVHDDIARLRTTEIRKALRTVAYSTAENWALAAEFFDDDTGQHCFRVGYLAGMLAREIGLSEEYCERIEHAARLHDIGKIGINELVLLKPGPLDPTEMSTMRAHAEVGAFLLDGASDPTLQMARSIAMHHHEWWNGSGYPKGLAGASIPLEARICALADVYDALTSARPYKQPWPHKVAVGQLLAEAPIHFDPALVGPFLKVLERYVPALQSGQIAQAAKAALQENALLLSRERLMEATRCPV